MSVRQLSLAVVFLMLCGCSDEKDGNKKAAESKLDSKSVEPKTVSAPQEETPTVVDAARFTEVAVQLGVNFTYQNGADSRALMVQSIGGGAGWLDFDQDGSPDLYLVQGGNPTSSDRPPNQLHSNSGSSVGFADVGALAGVDDQHYGNGVAIGDFDNDGFPDIYITNVGGNVLYHNLGDGTFLECTGSAGVDDPLWSTSAAWGDLDLDGDLDLYVCNYLDYDPYDPVACADNQGKPAICHPRALKGAPNSCFENLGDGSFRRVTDEWQVGGPTVDSKSLGVVIADFDGNNRPDVFVANDTSANFCFINQESGKFLESAKNLGCAMNSLGQLQASMGVATGDYNRDGFLDLYVTHFTEDSNTMYTGLGPAGFDDNTRFIGLHAPTLKYLGFGTVMADFNQDGLDELFVANGHVDRSFTIDGQFEMPPQLFVFDGKKWQVPDTSESPVFAIKRLSRGVASADFDGDGDLDLAVVNQNDQAWLLRNDSPSNNWLNIHLVGRKSNRIGIGAKVRLEQNGRTLAQELVGGSSFCSSHQPFLCFGLGESKANCTLEVFWRSGSVQKLGKISVNQTIRVEEMQEVVLPDRT